MKEESNNGPAYGTIITVHRYMLLVADIRATRVAAMLIDNSLGNMRSGSKRETRKGRTKGRFQCQILKEGRMESRVTNRGKGVQNVAGRMLVALK